MTIPPPTSEGFSRGLGNTERASFLRVSQSLGTDLELVSSTLCSERMNSAHRSANIHQASRHLQPDCVPTSRLSHKGFNASVRGVLSTWLALTQRWLKIITIITTSCSRPCHSLHIPLQRENGSSEHLVHFITHTVTSDGRATLLPHSKVAATGPSVV